MSTSVEPIDPADSMCLNIFPGRVLGQTMATCTQKHGLTNFKFVIEDGQIKKVCVKCEFEWKFDTDEAY